METIAPAVERGREMKDLIYRQDAIDAIDVKNVNEGIVSALQSIIEELPSAQQWTPVEKETPILPNIVLVCDSLGKILFDSYIDGSWTYCPYVVAWMPLPEPYQGGDIE